VRHGSLIHRLVHGATAVYVWIKDDIDTGRFARGAGTFESWADVLWTSDERPVSPHGLDNEIVPRFTQLVRHIPALLSILGELSLTDLIPTGVIAYHADKWQIKPDCRINIKTRQAEGSIAEQDKNFLFRQCCFRRVGERCANP
jgi:hypothetical protein